MAARSLSQYVRSNHHPPQPPTRRHHLSALSPSSSESQSNVWICQETELQMRTAELIEENAQQALGLLVQYAQSSRMSSLHSFAFSPF